MIRTPIECGMPKPVQNAESFPAVRHDVQTSPKSLLCCCLDTLPRQTSSYRIVTFCVTWRIRQVTDGRNFENHQAIYERAPHQNVEVRLPFYKKEESDA